MPLRTDEFDESGLIDKSLLAKGFCDCGCGFEVGSIDFRKLHAPESLLDDCEHNFVFLDMTITKPNNDLISCEECSFCGKRRETVVKND